MLRMLTAEWLLQVKYFSPECHYTRQNIGKSVLEILRGDIRSEALLNLFWEQWWANLDQAPEDLDKNIFRDLSPTPKP